MDSAACYTCLGMTPFESLLLAEWDLISGTINPPETFYRISQVGDVRISAVGDRRIYQP